MSAADAKQDSSSVVIEEATEVPQELVKAFESFRDRLGRSSSHYSPSASDIQEIVDSPSSHLLVARDEDGTVCGGLTLVVYRLPSGIRAWIEDVVVLHWFSGRGLGRQLVQEGLDRAKAAGAERVELLVDPNQIAARNMFQGMGFRPFDKSPYSMRL